jgi:hypothetical protein
VHGPGLLVVPKPTDGESVSQSTAVRNGDVAIADVEIDGRNVVELAEYRAYPRIVESNCP